MALRGSLHEFELAEIFQLISHEGKSGQFVLFCKDSEAFVIFYKGSIVSAGTTEHNFQSFLFKYLTDYKHYSIEELNELLYLCRGEIRYFTLELVNRKYLEKDELLMLVQTAIEDLACETFFLKEGHYRFDPLEDISEYIISNISFSVDAITMEAMRRIDEFKRIERYIRPNMVFSYTNKASFSHSPSPIKDPSNYILSLIDGKTTVAEICVKSILLPYRVYEILFGLWQNSIISPLSIKESPKQLERTVLKRKTFSSFVRKLICISTVCLWILICYFISLNYKNIVIKEKEILRNKIIKELSFSKSAQKIKIANINYFILNGYKFSINDSLISTGLISKRDICK
jgi:hypothetical protein